MVAASRNEAHFSILHSQRCTPEPARNVISITVLAPSSLPLAGSFSLTASRSPLLFLNAERCTLNAGFYVEYSALIRTYSAVRSLVQNRHRPSPTPSAMRIEYSRLCR